MAESITVTTVLQARGPAAALILSDDQVAALGSAKTPPVVFTVNGIEIAGRIGRMGGQNLLGFNKATRATLGVEAGDEITAQIRVDDGPREVEIPAALASEFEADPALEAAWDKLAPSARKEMARGIVDAKKDETRDRRVAKALQTLRDS